MRHVLGAVLVRLEVVRHQLRGDLLRRSVRGGNERLDLGSVRPAVSRLGFLGADDEIDGVLELIRDLDHVHQARVEAEDVDPSLRLLDDLGKNVLQLLVVQEVT